MSNELINQLIQDVNKSVQTAFKKSVSEIKRLFEKSVYDSIMDFYSSYSPTDYRRTYNLPNISDSTFVTANSNGFFLSVDSGTMNDYPGWTGNNPLAADDAFSMMFLGGEHGHGRWNMATSTAPFLWVDRDIQSGFGGQIQNIIMKNFSL